MPEEISKAEFIERERAAWQDVVKRLDFMAELVTAKTEKTLIKDASVKLFEALNEHKPLFKQRLQIELGMK